MEDRLQYLELDDLKDIINIYKQLKDNNVEIKLTIEEVGDGFLLIIYYDGVEKSFEKVENLKSYILKIFNVEKDNKIKIHSIEEFSKSIDMDDHLMEYIYEIFLILNEDELRMVVESDVELNKLDIKLILNTILKITNELDKDDVILVGKLEDLEETNVMIFDIYKNKNFKRYQFEIDDIFIILLRFDTDNNIQV